MSKRIYDLATTTYDGTQFLPVDKTGNNASLALPLSAIPPSTRQIIAGTGLSGGGDLSADRTLAIVSNTLATHYVDANTTDASEDTLWSDAVTLSTNGQAVAGKYATNSTSAATTKTYKAYVAGVMVASTQLGSGTSGACFITLDIIRTSTSELRVNCFLTRGAATNVVTYTDITALDLTQPFAVAITATVPSGVVGVAVGCFGYLRLVS